MSLEKWIKTDKKKDKKESQLKSSEIEKLEPKVTEQEVRKPIKYILICSKKGCGYQKTILKKVLNEKDKICPRCKDIMKIKK